MNQEGNLENDTEVKIPAPNPELANFLADHAPEIQDLVFTAQELFQELCGPASNFYFDATSAVCAGIGYTHKWQDSFVNTATYAKHVTLIFSNGASLPDPEGRLKGEGVRVRNFRLKGKSDLKDPYIRGLILEAAARAIRPLEPLEPIDYVKVYEGPRRNRP